MLSRTRSMKWLGSTAKSVFGSLLSAINWAIGKIKSGCCSVLNALKSLFVGTNDQGVSKQWEFYWPLCNGRSNGGCYISVLLGTECFWHPCNGKAIIGGDQNIVLLGTECSWPLRQVHFVMLMILMIQIALRIAGPDGSNRPADCWIP